ncbi:hypothetical protein BH10PSE9_BH10PSE9_01400 [soil metagenome]
MHWVLLVFALLAAVFSGLLLWWRVRSGRELALMATTETSKASEVAGKAPGTLVELKGTIECDAPVRGEFSGIECVYYRAMVEREVERQTRDSQGRSQTERSYITDSDKKIFAPARLADASGTVPLDFDGAEVEAEQTHRRTESSAIGLVGSLLNVSGTVRGYRYTEWAIKARTPLYVLGTALPGGKVGKTMEGSKTRNPFIISNKSEEQRTKSLGRTRLWTLVGAIALGLVAVTLLYFTVVNWGVAPTPRA